MKGALFTLPLLCACAGPGASAGPPLQSSELPRLDDVPRLLRPADGDYRRGGPLLRGGLAWDAGEPQRAAARLEAAKRVAGARPSAWALHAWVLLESGGPGAAESVAREGLAAYPADPALRAVLADALLRAADGADGTVADGPSAAFRGPATRREAGDDAETLLAPLFAGAQAADPYVLTLGARAALWAGAPEVALRRLDRLVVAGPLDTDALRMRARALERCGRPAEALPLYEQLAESAADDPLLLEEMAFAALGAARATGESAHYARAAGLLAQVAGLDPQHAPAWAGIGECAAARGRDEQAAEAWRRVLELDPDHVAAGLALAGYLRGAGDPAAAEAVLQGLLVQPLEAAEAAAVRAALAGEPAEPSAGTVDAEGAP